MFHDFVSALNTGFTYIDKTHCPDTTPVLVISKEIKNLEETFFHKTAPQFKLVNDLHFDSPMTVSTYNEIQITCQCHHWCQIAYQFSHEMCHLLIGKLFPDNFRWFEESIAELASLFFMTKLSDLWQQQGLLGCPEYSSEIKNYVSNLTNESSTTITLTDLSDEDSELSNLLRQNCYDRPKNRIIAIKLLPIFESDSYLWECVPMLADMSPDLTFLDMLSQWKNSAPSNHANSIQKVINLFTIPPSTN